MIVTEGPKLEENLKKVTPWWDLVTKYLIAAMMATALTCIVVQVTKDAVVCVPAVDCSKSNGSLPGNVSDDAEKLCHSLTQKNQNSKKTVLAKMVDRRLYDYVDSVCFQEMSWFTKFFPLFLLVEAVILLGADIVWTNWPSTSSALNHLVALTDECYSSVATLEIILHGSESSNGSGYVSGNSAGSPTRSSDNLANIPDTDALKVINLLQKADHFRGEYETGGTRVTNPPQAQGDERVGLNQPTENPENYDGNIKPLYLYKFYKGRTVCQIFICIISLILNLSDSERFFAYFGKTFQFQCRIDEFVFTKKYDHFECSHPLAPYFHITVILFIVCLLVHLVISLIALKDIKNHGNCYAFPGGLKVSDTDFAFLFYILKKHDKLYADRVSKFFTEETSEKCNQLRGGFCLPRSQRV